MTTPTSYHRCLAVHLHFAQPERMFPPKPSRWWRWLMVAGVPLAGLIMLSIDWARWLAS